MFDGFTLASIAILVIAAVAMAKIAYDSRRNGRRRHVHHFEGPGISRADALKLGEMEHGPLTGGFHR